MSKKIFLAAAALLLVAAGCNKSKQSSNSANQNQAVSENPAPDIFSQNGISVQLPAPGDTVSSPLNIKGFGLPAFEGVAGKAQLLDANNNVLGETQLKGDGTNVEPYNFFGLLNFGNPSGTGYVAVTLHIVNDNPSGDVSNERSIDVPLQVKK